MHERMDLWGATFGPACATCLTASWNGISEPTRERAVECFRSGLMSRAGRPLHIWHLRGCGGERFHEGLLDSALYPIPLCPRILGYGPEPVQRRGAAVSH